MGVHSTSKKRWKQAKDIQLKVGDDGGLNDYIEF